jgi:hypothetical protein
MVMWTLELGQPEFWWLFFTVKTPQYVEASRTKNMVTSGFQNFNFDMNVSNLDKSYKFVMYPLVFFFLLKQKIKTTIKALHTKSIPNLGAKIWFSKNFSQWCRSFRSKSKYGVLTVVNKGFGYLLAWTNLHLSFDVWLFTFSCKWSIIRTNRTGF